MMKTENIEDYLKRIRECSDEMVSGKYRVSPRLTVEQGIKNNFQINLKGSLDDWVSHLKSRYQYEGFQNFSKSHLFTYTPRLSFHTGEIPSDWEIENYNVFTIINYENSQEEIATARDAANLVVDMVESLKNQRISFELSTSSDAGKLLIKHQFIV